jgi:arsenate reductase-like glutaredoxin family protein
VAKGKKVAEFNTLEVNNEMVSAMLGPTGNLRAPTLIIGKTVVVGYNAELYENIFS